MIEKNLEESPARSSKRSSRNHSAVLREIGDLLKDCHQELLSLQEEVSELLPLDGIDPTQLRTFQRLDHITQVHDDLSRLMPAIADGLGKGRLQTDDLASILSLASIRDRLFDREDEATSDNLGSVTFF